MAGKYTWSYEGGAFEVHLRPSGIFYCPQYPDACLWKLDGDDLTVDFGQYGKYALKKEGSEFSGSLVGNAADWRKMKLNGGFSPEEELLFGEGGGSAWNFIHAGGEFEVEFRADGLNHFVCTKYPAHSHWSLEGSKVSISWDQFGEYELTLNAAGKSMEGSTKGNSADWRKATFVRGLSKDALGDVPKHGHGHSHGGAECSGHH